MVKLKLCWKWTGGGALKSEWLAQCASQLGECFDVFCEESELGELSAAGAPAQAPGEDWGEGSQAVLLAMIACGEADAAVWIDEGPAESNQSAYALRLCRARGVPIALDCSCAAAMLAGILAARAEPPTREPPLAPHGEGPKACAAEAARRARPSFQLRRRAAAGRMR